MISVSVRGLDLRFETRPDLFSPKAADAGTLAMLSLVEFNPEDKVLDLGCGYGLVGTYVAKLVDPTRVYFLDNDPAAIEVSRQNADLNGISGANFILSDGFSQTREMGFTKIIANPPYHVDFSVPKHFIEKGFNRLALQGSMWMVTKRLDWYRNRLGAIFGGVKLHRIGDYHVFEAVKRTAQYAGKRNG